MRERGRVGRDDGRGATSASTLRGLDSMASSLVAPPGRDARSTRRRATRCSPHVLRDQPTASQHRRSTDRDGAVGAPAAVPAGHRPDVAAAAVRRAQVFDDRASPPVSELHRRHHHRQADRRARLSGARRTGGHVVGVLGLGLNLVALQTVFAHRPLPDGSVVTLTDREGRVLARTLRPRAIRRAARFDPAPPTPRDVPRTADAAGHGRRRRGSTATPSIDRGPWLLSVGIPAAARRSRARRRTLRRNPSIGAHGHCRRSSLLALLWRRT